MSKVKDVEVSAFSECFLIRFGNTVSMTTKTNLSYHKSIYILKTIQSLTLTEIIQKGLTKSQLKVGVDDLSSEVEKYVDLYNYVVSLSERIESSAM